MHFTKSIASAALVAAVQAQSMEVQVVYVGQNPVNNATGAKFWPESITAPPGSAVQFQFWSGNHTATQSSFDEPCVRGAAPASNGTVPEGLSSGWQPSDASLPRGEAPVWSIMIMDSKPLWFYSAQGEECQEGMAMVINPSEDPNNEKTLEAYKAAAAEVEESDDGEGADGGSGGEDGSGSEGGAGGSDGGSGSGSGSGDGSGAGGEGGEGGDGEGAADGAAGADGTAAAAGLAAPTTLVLVAAAALALF